MHAESSGPGDETIKELLVEQLRDILHAEKQLTKALPKMAKAARSVQLQRLFETHLVETEAHAERLNECLRLLGSAARAKPCKGMAGLVEEGEEVMQDGKEKADAPADLALIGAAQRVEHYEMAAYTTARNLAVQMRQPEIVQLLTTSLGEEQNAGQLLDQVAQPLLSVARMPATVE
jgi:Mn-containing catalase